VVLGVGNDLFEEKIVHLILLCLLIGRRVFLQLLKSVEDILLVLLIFKKASEAIR
jgi:hypothetical protein